MAAVLALALVVLAGGLVPANACGPSAPLTSAEVLAFQLGIVDRGLARESLSPEQRAEIAKFRADVEALQKADKRDDARQVMTKIVAMFKTKELMGSVEPVVPGCLGPRTNAVTGQLVAIEIEPNVPGARCGNHYVLSIKDVAGKGTVNKLAVYDLAKAPYETLKSMLNKTVEAETLGSGVVGLRLVEQQQAAAPALSGLSPRKPC